MDFGEAHERHLASYRTSNVEVWCKNAACENNDEPVMVRFETEYGQGWYTPEECPLCHNDWTDKSPHDYWNMSDADLAAAWRSVDGANFATDYDGTVAERLNMIEDAVLQRIGAPDYASGDEQEWQDRIREFGSKEDG